MASGAEVIRKIKDQIREVDPREVHDLVQNGRGSGNGAVIVDAREILYCAQGNRSALAAKTMEDLLGYSNVESMTGGITLWKDRGFEVEVPRTFTPEQRERYSRHFLLPEVGIEG